MDLLITLQSFIKEQNSVKKCLQNIHPHISELFEECFLYAFDINSPPDSTFNQKSEYILNYLHDHLNTGDWNQISENKREAFTAASYIKALIILKLDANNIREAVKCIDKGFLLGLPLKSNINLLTQCAGILSKKLGSKMKRSLSADEVCNNKWIRTEGQFRDLPGEIIEEVKVPSLEEFYKKYFLPEKPVLIKGCMDSWSACEKWKDLNYLINIAGERTVPIELGSSYSAENFSQKLMTLREFVEKYFLQDAKDIGYLAQHDLLNQIPELKEDIRVPEYCCTTRNFEENDAFEPEINAWFGPKGTVSSLHYDQKDNFLCQVFGTKQVLMYAPADSDYIYPYEVMLLKNTSQVDPTKPDFNSFPNFAKTKMYKCILHSTEMLYIPQKWWHHVTALQKSFSVNFWWE